MNEHISGIKVPQALIDEMAGAPEAGYRDKAVEIATRLLKEIAPMVQGVHFMPLGWSDLVPQLANTAREAAG
jgi:methylenetetrahydrofolate reductase (NADPH)